MVEEVEGQEDLDWVSVSDASVGEAGTGVAIGGSQRVRFQREVLLQERHPGLGEIHGVYEQVRAARTYTGEVYVVCDCQGVVIALQNANHRTKVRKHIKGAYWNYHILINDMLKKREEEQKGEIHFVWIQSHTSRKGRLNECHTEQDRQAGTTANNVAQDAIQIPIPSEMWSIANEKGQRIHSQIRTEAEAEVKRRIFEDLLEGTSEEGEESQQVLKEIIQAMRRKQKPVRQVWSKIIHGTDKDKLGYLMRIRQDRLVLNERLAQKGIRESGDCKVCTQTYPERTETGDNGENIEHIWARCALGTEVREKLEMEVAKMIQDSTLGPE